MERKIDFDEIIKLIEDTYKIKKVRFMLEFIDVPDDTLPELPDYVSGELITGGERSDTK